MSEINLNELNDRSLDILADILDPYFELMKDPQFTKLYMSNITEAIKYACRTHKKETVQIAAILSGKKEEEYVVNPFTTPIVLLTAIGTYSKINKDLFISQDQSKAAASYGPAMENTEADEQQTNS